MSVIIKTHGVTKIYNKKIAVSNLSLSVRKGDIYGLIGSNGAGKTTLIRCIMGLVKLSAGEIEIFGENSHDELVKARMKIGCIVESPSLLLNFNAFECLKTHALLYGIKDKQKIYDLLHLVGLTDTGNKKVKDFSLGMRQRMAVAQALINDPEILILDEPTNGMDPQGIIQMREFLKMLVGKNNITILVSSHILAELQQYATRFGIIKDGELIAELTHEEIISQPQTSLESYFISKVGAQSWGI